VSVFVAATIAARSSSVKICGWSGISGLDNVHGIRGAIQALPQMLQLTSPTKAHKVKMRVRPRVFSKHPPIARGSGPGLLVAAVTANESRNDGTRLGKATGRPACPPA
jgi:hypothetical protein